MLYKIMKKILLMQILVLFFSLNSIAEERISFSNLGATERIEVEFTSTGCFHSYANLFSFSGGKMKTAKVSKIIREGSDKEKKFIEKERKEISTVQLSKKDLQKLDNLISFYRRNSDDMGCTTIDNIKMICYRDNKVISREEFEDGSCKTPGMKNVLTFYALAQRIEKTE